MKEIKICEHCFNIDSCRFMRNSDGSRLSCDGKDIKCIGYIVDEELTSKPKEANMVVAKKKVAKKVTKKVSKKKAVAKKPAKKAVKKVAKKAATPATAELH